MIMRVVTGGVRRKAACRAVFETLVDGEDHELACAAQFPFHQYPRQISLCSGIVTFVTGKNFFDFLTDAHDRIPHLTGCLCLA